MAPRKPPEAADPADVDARIRELLAGGRGPKQIAAALAGELRLPKRELYARATALREAGESS